MGRRALVPSGKSRFVPGFISGAAENLHYLLVQGPGAFQKDLEVGREHPWVPPLRQEEEYVKWMKILTTETWDPHLVPHWDLTASWVNACPPACCAQALWELLATRSCP